MTVNGVQYFFCIKMTDLKLCANCNELKPLDEYHKHKRKPIKNRTFIKNNKDR